MYVWMHVAPSKCKLSLEDWIGPKPNHFLVEKQPGKVNRFGCFGNSISCDGRVLEEVSTRIEKVRLEFANLKQLSRRCDIRLSIEGRVYATAVRRILFYSFEV